MPSTRSKIRIAEGEDAFALLKADHQLVKALFDDFRKLVDEDGPTNEKGAIARRICDELSAHAQMEEEIFYPAYKDAVRSRDDKELYFEALEEHHVVDLVMPEVKSTETDADEFGAKAKVLKDLIEYHAQEEEKQMFPKARKAMGAARLKQLGQEIEERKQELSTGLFGRTIERIRGGRRRVA